MQEYSVSMKKAALISATLTSFLTPFMASSINVALPSIGREFSMDAMSLSWVSTVYLLASAMFLVPFGKIGDIYGRKKIFLSGLVIYTLSSLICSFSVNSMMLISFRIFQGIGSSMVFGSGVAIISSIYPPGERGKAIGLTIGSVYLGLSMGPFIGGILTHSFGWRCIFILNFPLGLIAIIYVITNLKGEWAEAKGEKLDIWGTFLYCISLVLIMFGLSKLPVNIGYFSIAAGITVLLIFIYLELKISNPVLNIKLFKGNPIFAFSNLAALINYSATFAVTFLLSFYLQYIKMLNPQTAGSILIAQPIVMATFSPLAGRLSDKIDSRVIASIGMGLTVLGLILLVFLNEQTSFLYVIFALIILGLGFALFSSPNTNAVMSSVERKYLGVASATIGTMRLIGQMLSMGIAMFVISIFVGKVQITPQNHIQLMTSIRVSFLIFVVLCIIGIFASLARGKNSK
jgi:EmrB/QacA subfamily drug resistance transporter